MNADQIKNKNQPQINADNKIKNIMDPEVRRAEINQVTDPSVEPQIHADKHRSE